MFKKLIYLAILSFTFSSYANIAMTDENSTCPLAVLMAIVNNKTPILENHLTYGADPNANLEGCEGNEYYDGFPRGSTLLYIAAYYAPVTVGPTWLGNNSYQLLIDRQARQDVVNEAGHTPLDIRNCIHWRGKYACRRLLNINPPRERQNSYSLPTI